MSVPAKKPAPSPASSKAAAVCYHCGAPCLQTRVVMQEKQFCCEGCRLVYELLEANGLCNYYELQSHPGLSQVKAIRNDKYDYLDDAAIAERLFSFTDGRLTIVTLFIPAIHCSSCMWLLEHLHRLRDGITDSRIHFSAKEVTIRFDRSRISLREVVELLATLGYEPRITLEDPSGKKAGTADKHQLYKLGVAGFCFGNIMLMSFPEYLSAAGSMERQYVLLFRVLNLLLSIPVVFYAASEFFSTAWAGLRQKILNIDAPIVLAILITYGRSLYEILSGTGAGYLDSMSGIVFFMLVGRVVQERVYGGLSFHRDYKAYFPMAATVLKDGLATSKPITELSQHDKVKVFHQEIIPADGVLRSGLALIDYSFVSGESDPVSVAIGEKIYAGGRQTGEALIMEVTQPITGSYLTTLWNHRSFSRNKTMERDRKSFIHVLSKHFSLVLFSLAALTAVYWAIQNPAMILPSVSAMLIVACPCALLLTATYTNANLLRILSDNGLYLRDANVIEQMAALDHLVFDKTGTLTQSGGEVHFSGMPLTDEEQQLVTQAARHSTHPKSRQLASQLKAQPAIQLEHWREYTGQGISATYRQNRLKIGSAAWVDAPKDISNADVYINLDGRINGVSWDPVLRTDAAATLDQLQRQYKLSLLSGDHDRHRDIMEPFFSGSLYFEQKPEDKLAYIDALQQSKQKVAMIGDGLNDAGALQQSDVGITLADDINNFSPACDAILRADQLGKLPAMLALTRRSRWIIYGSFLISILYNIAGLTVAIRGQMNPMIAAILMPLSTLTIVLITTGASNILAAKQGLVWREQED